MQELQLNDLTIRPATKDDLDGVCEVIRAYSLELFGVDNNAKRNVEMTWEQPGFQVETDTRVAVTSEGRIIGYAEVEDTEEPYVSVGCWQRVHPEFRELGLEPTFLSWIEERASQANSLFETRGYTIIRHFMRMTVELDHDIPEPVWAQGVSVRAFVFEDDLEQTVHAFRDSFQDHWGHVEKSFEEELKQWDYWIRSDERFDPTLTFLAMAGDEIVGFASCDPEFSEDPDMGFVAVLGVRRAWRRKGIALALLHHSFREFQQRGQKRVTLGVDATSLTGAHKLYEAAGMNPTRQINVFEKELRSGIDLSLQTLGEGGTTS